jgi:hypothetical protein
MNPNFEDLNQKWISGGLTLIPLIDLLNHKQPESPASSDYVPFFIHVSPETRSASLMIQKA